jgi:hypothetical protein
LLSKNLATLEENGMGPAKQERAKSNAVEQKSAMLTAQVLWAAHAFNATPQAAAQQVVADLFDVLARGGTVSVRVEGLDGGEHLLEVAVRR